MTLAFDSFRHAEACPRPCAGTLFARLAFHEDRRRASQFQHAKPSLSPSLALALRAFRSTCADPENPTYTRDICSLADNALSDVDLWLLESGIAGDAATDWFQHAEDVHAIHQTADDQFTSDAFFCDQYEAWYSRHIPAYTVYVGNRNGCWLAQTWCEDAVDADAFLCDASDRYYSSIAFDAGQLADGGTICKVWAELNDYWADSGGYWRPPSDHDFDSDDEDDGPIPAYHDGMRLWSMDTAREAATAYYGLEIELRFSDSTERLGYYEEMSFPTPDLTAERDGSLDTDEGLEVISRPLRLAELRQHRNPLQQAMHWAVDYGAESPSPEGYGVHITTNAQRLSEDHRKRLIDATYDMRSMTEFVAGRKHCGDYYSYAKHDRACNKYTAVHERGDGSFEFRVFQGTPEWQTLLSYIEYVDALTDWTRNPANPTQGSVGQALFRAWVQATGRYPVLANRFTTTLTKEAVACALPLLSRAA